MNGLSKAEWILISEALKVASNTYMETASMFPVGVRSNAKSILIESAWNSKALQKKVLEIVYSAPRKTTSGCA